MKINDDGLAIIKAFEGLRLKAYRDTGGVWTIGYGHTRGVKPGMTCTEAQAVEWLREDVAEAEEAVSRMVKVPLTGNEFSALVSFCFNVGQGKLKKSQLLAWLNRGQRQQAADQFPRWRFDGGTQIPGLVARRACERMLFLKPEGNQ